jgi:hypothetical protein
VLEVLTDTAELRRQIKAQQEKLTEICDSL